MDKEKNTNMYFKDALKEYSTLKELKAFQKGVRKDSAKDEIEQEWVDSFLMPLVDLMGDEYIWNCMIPDIELYGLEKQVSIRGIKPSDKDQAHFSSTHWNSRKANTLEWFDSYKEYQMEGTNQFCQTFALMYLLGALPPVNNDLGLSKYYFYAFSALLFIKGVIERCITHKPSRKIYLKMVNECLKKYQLTINAITVF